jgi:site-specific recombinase XerD
MSSLPDNDYPVPADLAPEFAAAISYAKAEKAEATRRAYRTDFRLFQDWCFAKTISAMPASPETIAAYLAHGARQGAKASTLGRRVDAELFKDHAGAGLL